MYKIAVFSEEPLLLTGLQYAADQVDDLAFSYLNNEESFVEAIRSLQPDVLLIDMGPSLDLQTVRQIHAMLPSTRCVLWTRFIPPEVAYHAIEIGVRGVLKKTCSFAGVLDCVRTVCAGELYFERTLTSALLTLRPINLTRRESQLISLLSNGLKNKEIATALNITEGTVKVYISRLLEKLGAKDRLELALYGLRDNGIEPVRGVHAPLEAAPRSIVFRQPA